MKKSIRHACLALKVSFIGLVASNSCFCHETQVHATITESAALASPQLLDFLREHLGSESEPFLNGPKLVFDAGVQPRGYFSAAGSSPIVWLKKGSIMEDDEVNELVGTAIRFQNHFYDPTKAPPRELTDKFDGFGIGVDSFKWGSDKNFSNWYYQNLDTFQNARDYEYSALTATTRAAREANIGHMLYSLGHVLHLNQDQSSPEHTRNDNHNAGAPTWDDNAWFEPYGGKHFGKKPDWFTPPPLVERGWLHWRDAGFTELEAFWDRNLYPGNPNNGNKHQIKQALDDDASSVPGKQLGLAEFSNGNFLGGDATYGEHWSGLTVFSDGYSKHHFWFPSLYTSTTFAQVVDSMTTHDDGVEYRDGTTATHVYIRKNADGVNVPHHSRLTYLGVKRYWVLGATTSWKTTINDPNVLDDYHAILIPKAVKYSAGILDYFFRGRIEVVDVVWNATQYTITIRNQSGQQLASGGTFTVLREDANGNRTPVTPQNGVALTQNVADNGIWQFNFPGPQVTTPTRFIVVYRGTIGLDGVNPSDPVDAGIAIAAKQFTMGGAVFVWGTPTLDVVGDGTATFAPANTEGNTVNAAAAHAGGTELALADAHNFGYVNWQSAVPVNVNLHIIVSASHEPGGTPPTPAVGWGAQISIISEDGMSSELLLNEGGLTVGNNGTFDFPFVLPIRSAPREVQFYAAAVVSGQPSQPVNAGSITLQATFSPAP
jgi:hypothetical protein